MLYETASSCLVGKVNKKGRPYKNVTCQCRKTTLHPMCSAEFPDLLHYKYQRALVPPGEAVGLLAAQVYIHLDLFNNPCVCTQFFFFFCDMHH